MKVIPITDIQGTEREVHCPKGGFASFRYLLAKESEHFSIHKTVVPKGEAQHWHYKNHIEACYCVHGLGVLTDLASKKQYLIEPDTLYYLDNHDDHTFQALEDTVLISVFNPPVTGQEVHGADGSYDAAAVETDARDLEIARLLKENERLRTDLRVRYLGQSQPRSVQER